MFQNKMHPAILYWIYVCLYVCKIFIVNTTEKKQNTNYKLKDTIEFTGSHFNYDLQSATYNSD